MVSTLNLSGFLVFFSLVVPLWAQFIAPYDPSPFNIVGYIDHMTLDTDGGVLAGGTITVDGVTYIVPQNTLATLPALNVAWGELFVNGTANLPGGVSWQANLLGNRVNGEYICGLVYIAQNPAQLLQGFITSINITTGHFTVGIGEGLDCVINDPTGTYALPYFDHPLWATDPQNPGIHAQSGFPVCIPRAANDPLCPSKNRPLDGNGNPAQIIHFGDPATIGPNDPDPRLMAPLAVGDYITFTGTRVGGGLLAINSLNANLGLFTAPGTKPVYVNCEAAQYAIRDATVPGAIAETRADAWVSDIQATVQWFAQDIDPCTGETTERDLLLQQASPVAPLGRLQYRLGAFDVSPATKNVGFRASQGTMLTPNNLTAGLFIQPIFLFLFPELILAGAPAFANEFESIPFLVQGTGPYIPGTFGLPAPDPPVLVGQLNPWPGAVTPSATSCAPPTSIPPTTPTSSAPVTTASGVVDTLTLLSVTQTAVGRGGVTTVTVTAISSDPNAKLFMSITATTTTNPAPMNDQGNGVWELAISGKVKATAVTITSDLGGSVSGPA